MVARGLRGRCPRCGSGGVFRNFFDLHERCPSCGLKFEREPGYWVGAMVIITAVTVGVFITVLVGGIALTWPDVPWGWLLGVTVGANLAGIPAMSVPCGFSSDGLPIGLHLQAPAFAEALLLQAGHQYQQATDWHTRRPASS